MRNTPSYSIPLILLTAWLGSYTSQAQLLSDLKAIDVGSPPLAGSTTVNGPGSFSVKGSGEYKNGASDNFHFAYTNVTGNFDYQVRVESFDVPSQWSKVALMARETTDATVAGDQGSRYLAMAAYPPPPRGNQLIFIRREQTDTATQDDIQGMVPAYPNTWLRLRRLGDTLVGYTGTNGADWVVQGIHDTSAWPEGALRADLLLGLALSSANNTAAVTAQCREFGVVPSGKPASISVPLKALTVNKGKTAKFSITVSGYDPFYAQWYTNGTAINGGTNISFGGTLTYTTPPLTLKEDQTLFSVVVSNSVNSVTNASVLLHVVDDSTPPAITAAAADNSGMIHVVFSEEVSVATAQNVSNYTLNGAPEAAILDAALSSNGRVASLTLSSPVTSTNATLTVTRIQDLVGNVSSSTTVPLWPVLAPDNIVANSYPNDDRASGFASVTDGVVDAGWQTNGDKDHRPQFAGLIYTNLQTFDFIQMDLGDQNEFGGSFMETPKLYLLKNNVDTDTKGPETDLADWHEVAAPLVSPNLFDANVDPNPSPASPICFDLSALSAGARAGYGWAVGGVNGDNSGFIRISELRAYGQSGGVIEVEAPTLAVARDSADRLVISWPAAAAQFVLTSTASLTSPVWTAVSEPAVVAGANATVTLTISSGTQFYRLEPKP